MSDSIRRPNAEKVLARLKAFQRQTVEYVFRRMYVDSDQTRRFLIADEVGLGKTLVAKGLIAKVVDHLWGDGRRIDIVYICSNSDIARQNINRLNITRQDNFELASRITMLPVQLGGLNKKLNFVSFTPGTSFDLKFNMGLAQERVLLYWLLQLAWGRLPKNAIRFMRGAARYERFNEQINRFDRNRIDRGVAEAFKANLENEKSQAQAKNLPGLQARFDTLCDRYSWLNSAPDYDARRERSAVIGELRALLARTCLQALQPDLIILDEFQRFRHLLESENEAAQLAKELFNYSDQHTTARVLLLSATPYKMYTTHGEEGEHHYEEFVKTLKFLLNNDSELAQIEQLIEDYRSELFRLGVGSRSKVLDVKRRLQSKLSRVMSRTERLAVSANRDGMLLEVQPAHLSLAQRDLEMYLGYEQLAAYLKHHSALEYWKSAPYLLNFMENYQFKREFDKAMRDSVRQAEWVALLNSLPTVFLSPDDIDRYEAIDSANARLRALTTEVIESGAWQMLWIPPALPYYQLMPPFGGKPRAGFTKRLIFSSWRVVPKVIAVTLSYAAERATIKAFYPEARYPRNKRLLARLLQFSRSEGRLTGMPVLGLIYPCLTLARECDLLSWLASRTELTLPRLDELLLHFENKIIGLLDNLNVPYSHAAPEDERWYWAAPILLDLFHAGRSTHEWFDQEDLEDIWAGGDSESTPSIEGEETRWDEHVALARNLLHGNLRLGSRPNDLAKVLAQMAIAGLGVVALRSLARITERDFALFSLPVRNAASRIAWSFLYLFNLQESIALIRSLYPDEQEPYWRKVLRYCADGGLQSVLDEYAHILKDSLGLSDSQFYEDTQQVADVICGALTLKTSSPDVDFIQISASLRTVARAPQSMRGHFALRFGDEKSEDSNEPTRADQVRSAFNSPFWPFVLATTSIGQEGLDFHQYCHAVVHWNLPSNPVDLEQREGRIHRYKGHAIRKNIANQHLVSLVAQQSGSKFDPWRVLFDLCHTPNSADLMPFWIFPGEAHIERHVPALPLSREVGHMINLRRSLAIYRMVFGHNRQEDLLIYLSTRLPEADLQNISDSLRIDLTPPANRNK